MEFLGILFNFEFVQAFSSFYASIRFVMDKNLKHGSVCSFSPHIII